VLKVTVPTAKPVLPDLPLEGADAAAARTGQRPAWWPGRGWAETPLYDADALRPGHQLDGPAIVAAPLTTVVVPPGMQYRIDRHGLGLLQAGQNDQNGAER
jgi:N-methylhydantoinase A/oxoprolinase/acetone carboxylase beta subunit